MKKLLLVCILALGFVNAQNMNKEKMLRMISQLDKLDQLDQMDFDDAIYKAKECIIMRKFNCASTNIKKATRLINSSEKKSSVLEVEISLSKEKKALREEQAREDRIERRMQRAREEAEERRENERRRIQRQEDKEHSAMLRRDMVNYIKNASNEIATLNRKTQTGINSAVRFANEATARNRRIAERKKEQRLLQEQARYKRVSDAKTKERLKKLSQQRRALEKKQREALVKRQNKMKEEAMAKANKRIQGISKVGSSNVHTNKQNQSENLQSQNKNVDKNTQKKYTGKTGVAICMASEKSGSGRNQVRYFIEYSFGGNGIAAQNKAKKRFTEYLNSRPNTIKKYPHCVSSGTNLMHHGHYSVLEIKVKGDKHNDTRYGFGVGETMISAEKSAIKNLRANNWSWGEEDGYVMVKGEHW